MNFKRFLTEQAEFSFDDVLEKIKQECHIFLRETEQPLFRGIPMQDNEHAFFTPHPKDRPPRDSGKHDVFMFNAMIEAAFGIEDIRSHTLFATGDDSMAEEYGDLHFTFPVGKFKCLWARTIKDSVQDLDHWHDMKPTLKNKGIPMDSRTYYTLWGDLANKYRTAGEWVYDLNGNAERVTNKIIASLEAADAPFLELPENGYKVLIDALTFMGKHHYKLGDIDLAISSENEILIYESQGYYSVPTRLVYDQMVLEKNPMAAGRHRTAEQYKFLLSKLKTGT